MPQTNKQHAVPQNIMDVEFKLIGDLTMRQFAYVIIFGGVAYFASVLVIGVFKYPMVIFFAMLGFGLAFVPVGDRGLDEWIVNFLKSMYGPTQRIWMKEPTIPSAFLHGSLNVIRQEMIALAPTSSRRKLEEYLQYQNTQTKADPLDIPEAQYAKMVRDAYSTETQITSEPAASPSVGVSVLEPEVMGPEDQLPIIPPVQEKQSGQVTQAKEQPREQKLPSETGQSAPKPAVPPESKGTQVSSPPAKRHVTSLGSGLSTGRKRVTVDLAPITPDMHAGRRFTNLLRSTGEIVLPIRGERMIHTAEEEDFEQDVRDKAEKLKQLLSQIKGEVSVSKAPAMTQPPQTPPVTHTPIKPVSAPVPAAAPVPITVQTSQTDQKINTEAQELVGKLKEQNEQLSKEIENLKTDTSGKANTEKEALLKRLEIQKQRTQEDYAKLEQQVLELQSRLKQQTAGAIPTGGPAAVRPIYAKIQPLSVAPNVITGIVKKPDGGMIEAALIIIKNDKGEAVRAFKSNKLGQFSLTTPLASGVYTLEVVDAKGANCVFDIISVEAKGEVIPPLELNGRLA